VMNLKNLAQGEFVILGGYISWYLQNAFGINPILSMPLVILVMFVFGWVTYLLVIRWVIDRDLFTSLLATFGFALVIAQSLNLVFGSETKVARSHLPTFNLEILGGVVSVSGTRILGLFLCAIVAGGMIFFMKRSRMGQAIRATAQDPRAAKVMGINTDRIYAFTFAINSAICGAAGALIAMMFVLQPFYGMIYSIRSFVIVTAAGLGNLPGVLAASVGLGALESYTNHIFGADYQQFIVVFALVVVLMWRVVRARKNREVVQ
jgi:branched-chain amino acid transport system permease protein